MKEVKGNGGQKKFRNISSERCRRKQNGQKMMFGNKMTDNFPEMKTHMKTSISFSNTVATRGTRGPREQTRGKEPALGSEQLLLKLLGAAFVGEKKAKMEKAPPHLRSQPL